MEGQGKHRGRSGQLSSFSVTVGLDLGNPEPWHSADEAQHLVAILPDDNILRILGEKLG
jgi:hypothetical protein